MLRPFRMPAVNWARSLSDLFQIAYFLMIQLCDWELRRLDYLSLEELESLTEEELYALANR